MSRMMSRLSGRMYAWFESKSGREVSRPLPRGWDRRARMCLEGLEARDVPAQFTVLNTNDSGAGSLRQAFTNANSAAGADEIVFDALFSTGVHTIALQTALPTTSATAGQDLTIIGPGADHLVITRDTSKTAFSRPITLDGSNTYVIENLTLSGFSGASTGTAIYANGTSNAPNVTVNNCYITGNTTTGTYGAIYMFGSGTLTVNNSTLSGNSSAGGGGAIRVWTADLTVNNSTLVNNTSGRGGAISLGSTTANTIITNSTITGNSALTPLTTAGYGGGGIASGTTASLDITGSIVANNFAANGRHDFALAATMTTTVTRSLVGVADTGFTYNDGGGNATGTALAPLDPLLSLVNNYGGAMPTMVPVPGSPALDAHSPGATSKDQRGLDRPDTLADYGATERQAVEPPMAGIPVFANVTANNAGTNPYVVYVNYYGINTATLGNDDVLVTGPNTLNTNATFNSFAAITGGAKAKYTFVPPGGTWDPADSGTVTIALVSNKVTNASAVPVPAGTLGTFRALIPATITVSTTADSGAGSLRQAILDANAVPGTADTIVFDSSFTTAKTINLLTVLPTIADPVTITGPGSSLLTIQRDSTVSTAMSMLTIADTTAIIAVNVSGITFKGNASTAITTSDETVSLTDIVVTGVSTTSAGGGIRVGANSTGKLSLTNSAITGNTTTSTGAGITAYAGTTLVIDKSTIANNVATGAGGGINFTNSAVGQSLTLTNSTVSGNTSKTTTANYGGGGISFPGSTGAGGFLIRNSTIAFNSAAGSGGGIVFRALNGVLNPVVHVQNSTIANNTANSSSATQGQGGGGIAVSTIGATAPTLDLESVIVTGNVGNGAGNGFSDLSINASATLEATFSAVSDPDGFAFGGSSSDNLANGDELPGALKLGTFGLNNGGTTKTFLLLAGSSALGKGSNPSNVTPALTVDQNGTPRVQPIGTGVIDIGATERIVGTPGATPGPLPTVAVDAGSNPYTFTVTYTDDTAMSRATIGNLPANDIEIVRVGGGFSAVATFVSADSAVDAASITATYKFTAPGGLWDSTDNGTYQVNVLLNGVKNSGNVAVPASTIGTITVNAAAPAAVATAAKVVQNSAATNPYTFTVSYSDANAIDVSSIVNNNAAVRVTGPGGYDVAATYVGIDTPSNGTPRVATYQITPPGGTWDTADAGTYSIVIQANQVKNASPGTFVAAGTVGTFAADVGTTFTVTTTADSGAGSLRQALLDANATTAVDVIEFGPLFATPQTITLTSGELLVSQSAVVTGPGAKRLTITGSSRAFNVNNASSVIDVTISNMTISGISAAVAGFAIQFNNEKLTLDNMVVSGNTGSGGAITATTAGSSILVTNSLVSNNKSTGAGGGFSIASSTTGSTFVMRNTTVSGNSSSGLGGGIYHSNTAAGITVVTISNSTIVNNTSTGGGGLRATNTTTPLTLISTIVAGNAGPASSPDILNFIVTSSNSAIGDATGWAADTSTNDIAPGTDLKLLPLADNGGQALTHAFDFFSPLRNTGSNPVGLATDARGAGFARSVPSGSPDIGAYEFDTSKPFAGVGGLTKVTADAPGVNNPYTFTVTYADDAKISRATVGNQPDDDVQIVRVGGGFTTTAKFVSADQATDSEVIVATYSFTPPGGSWDMADAGTYQVNLLAATVKNTNAVAATAGTLGSFTVNFPTTYVVTNTNDAGAGSLRQAVLDANANSGLADTIVFEATLFSNPQTIVLTSTELVINDAVTILGPGKSLLTVTGNNARRIFNINSGVAGDAMPVTIQDMTLTAGSISGSGGAIVVQDENLTLTNVNITNSKATTSGAAIHVTLPSDNTLVINGGTFSGNSATTDGGVINVLNPTTSKTFTLRVSNAAMTANTAGNDGGAIAMGTASGSLYNLLIESTLLASNITGKGETTGDGSALYFRGTVGADGVVIRNSTVTGNSAGASTSNTTSVGAALSFPLVAGIVTIQNSTIVRNTAVSTSPDAYDGGGGIAISNSTTPAGTGQLVIQSSIVAENVSANGHPDISSEAPVDYSYSAIGTQSFTDGNVTNNVAFNTPLNLGSLFNNGGQSQTIALLAGSPAINAGLATTTPGFPNLTTDQRGPGFARLVGTEVDIGAFERVPGVPSAVVSALPGVTSDLPGSNNPYTFTVTYADDSAINISTVGNQPNDDVRVVRVGGGLDVFATFVSADVSVDSPTVVATYKIIPPGGTWDGNDNGTYEVRLPANAVKNTANTAVPAVTLGSFVVNAPAPSAIASAGNVSIDSPSTNPYTFTVTYADANAIDVASVINNNNAVRVTGPNGFDVAATYVSIDDATNGTPRTATYQITPPVNAAAGWDSSDNGGYQIVVQAGQVKNQESTFVAAGTAGSFTALVGGLITVTNTNDAGSGSLRDAIALANADPGPDTIVFGSLFNTAQTINLTSGALVITENVTVQGKGANLTTISAGGLSRVFQIANTSAVLNVTLAGMKVTGGFAAGTGTTVRGGGIDVTAETVTLDSLWVTGNTSGGVGGGVSNTVNGTNLTILNSTIDHNVAQGGDTTYGGGGVLTNLGGNIVIRNSTIANNTALAGVGGGFVVYSGTTSVTIENTTVVGNSSSDNGGGGRIYGGTPTTILNSLFADNLSNTTNKDLYFSSATTANVNYSAFGTLVGATLSGTSGDNITNATNLQLGALQNNGGPTPTIALGDTSAAKDVGPTISSFAFDQRGVGYARIIGGKADIGAFEVQPAGAPAVSTFTVNNGAAQRSRITRIDVTFASAVTPATFNAAGSIRLVRPESGPGVGPVIQVGGTGGNGVINVTQGANANTLTLTFANPGGVPEVAGVVEYGSLGDGRWRLEIPSAGGGAGFTSNPATPAGQIRRLFGDLNGDGTVDGGTDFAEFKLGNVTPATMAFDFNGDGTIDGGTDFAQFGTRFGKSL